MGISAQSTVLGIIGIFFLETIVTILVNPEEQIEIIRHDKSEGQFTQDRSETFRSRAATFVGFTIVIATFLLSNQNQDFSTALSLQFVWLTLGFLLLSYQMKSLTNLNRFWINMQEKTFEYGFLSLLGLILFLSIPYRNGAGAWALRAGIVLVVAFRFYAVFSLLRGLQTMWDQQKDTSRREYLKYLIISRYEELSGGNTIDKK